jgi:hypothetical protein
MRGWRQPLSPWRALLLALCLLAAQAAGLAHAYAHGHGHAHRHGHGHSHAHAHDGQASHPLTPAAALPCDDAHAHALSWPLLQLPAAWLGAADSPPAAPDAYGHDEASAECRLYDQLLGHADALLGLPGAALPPAQASAQAPALRAPGGRPAAAAYQARAPPRA